MSDTVAGLWSDIADWLHQHAPTDAALIHPPAAEPRIAQVEAALGRPIPGDLRQWWQQADGVGPNAGAYLLPWGYAPMSCQDALEDRAVWLDVAAQLLHDPPSDIADDELVFTFHPLFLPIGNDHAGSVLAVDLRDGPRHGHIGIYDNETAWNGAAYFWTSVTEMLTDTRNALVAGEPALTGFARRNIIDQDGFRIYRAEISPDHELQWREEG